LEIQIENVQKCKNQGWHAVFDLILVFEGGRTVRVGCCGVEFIRKKPYLRLPTKIRRDTGEPYQLNFFDNDTWRDMVDAVSDYFKEGA
jgi:hypothetical protein